MRKEKTVLVTGSDGFIGSNLVRDLRTQGYTVIEFDRNKGDVSTFHFQFESLDHVIHLASLVFVPDSWKDPVSFYRTNVMGTINLLELCREKGCRMTYVSSYIYGPPQYLPVDENHPSDPASPYNHSKLLAEDACRFYAATFGVPVVVLRPVNVYGPGQHGEFLIPKIIRQVMNPDITTIEVMDLRPKRDFIFIDDFLDAIRCSLNVEGFGIYNVGSGKSVSVEEIIIASMRLSGIHKPMVAVGEERKNEIFDVYINHDKITRELGWVPKTSFETGLNRCLASFLK